ncbi:MAG: RDD family protein [Actinomycetota bacterium]
MEQADPNDRDEGRARRPSLLGRAVGAVAPAVLRQIDTNELVEAVDVNAIADDLDLDALLERLDVNQIANRLDLDALVDRLDVDRVAERLDVDALVDRLDVNEVAARLDMTSLTAGVTQDVAVSGVDLVRRQLVRADATVESVVGRVVRRDPAARPVAPGRLVDASQPEDVDELPQRRDVSGHYAGPVTRLLALAGDVLVAVGLQAVLAWVAWVFLGLVFDVDPSTGSTRWVGLFALGAAFVVYFWAPVALFGRTLAMTVLGLAVVRRDGGIASGRRSFVRAAVMPVSIVFPVLLLGMALGRERRTLYDAVSGTVEVYDWGAREAEQPDDPRAAVRPRPSPDAADRGLTALRHLSAVIRPRERVSRA